MPAGTLQTTCQPPVDERMPFVVKSDMVKKQDKESCCELPPVSCNCGPERPIGPMFPMAQDEKVCCGPPSGPPSGPFERPGYRLLPFVAEVIDTATGPVPRVKTILETSDHLSTARVRWGIRRDQYKVAPGLYCIGHPNAHSPVLVTANYKLSFDRVRSEANLPAAWILVVDTRGINVWCAAGKGTFSTEEVVRQVRAARLDAFLAHRRLILPQLAATGVSARNVTKECGFTVIWGPVRIGELRRFIDGGMNASLSMRQVTFPFYERLVLVPVELSFIIRHLPWVLAVVFLLSGIGANVFSFQMAWTRGLWMAAALAGGVLSGSILTPALLPWIPGRAFSLKGVWAGLLVGLMIGGTLWHRTSVWEVVALLLFTMALSSFLAMNFTGATPFTSPSGVEKEMRKALPAQFGTILAVIALWITAAFR